MRTIYRYQIRLLTTGQLVPDLRFAHIPLAILHAFAHFPGQDFDIEDLEGDTVFRGLHE